MHVIAEMNVNKNVCWRDEICWTVPLVSINLSCFRCNSPLNYLFGTDVFQLKEHIVFCNKWYYLCLNVKIIYFVVRSENLLIFKNRCFVVFMFTDFQVLLNKDYKPVTIRHQGDLNITRLDIIQNCDFRFKVYCFCFIINK
jgi:hypothetical protein